MTARDPLVQALARRFSQWEDRNRLARAAGITDPQLTGDAASVWEGLLDEALAQGRTHALANAMDAEGFPRLAAAIKDGGLPDSRPRWAVLGAVLMAASLFLFLFFVMLDPGKRQADARLGTTARQVLQEAREASEEAEEAAAADEAAAEDAPEGEGSEEPTLDAHAAAAEGEEPAADPGDAVATGWGACTAAPGERIGYAWAGTDAPSDPWQTQGRVNVRADYPRAENGWETQSATVCILPADVVIPLPEGTLPVEGGAVYVPIVAPVAP